MVLQKLKNWGKKQLAKHYTKKAKIEIWDKSTGENGSHLSKKEKIARVDRAIQEKKNQQEYRAFIRSMKKR